MPSLLDLSTELLLDIIDDIGISSSEVTNDIPATYYKPLTHPAIINLSSCCKRLRDLVAPTLFRKIRLRNTHKSGRSVEAVLRSPWVGLVKELHYEGLMTLNDYGKDDSELYCADFPSSVTGVLSHLERLPQLQTLTIRFTLGDTQEADQEGAKSDFWLDHRHSVICTHDEVLQIEREFTWRALMAKTYNAISTSALPQTLTTLEMRNVPPAELSSFSTEPWEAFLRSLKVLRFHMRAAGGRNEPHIGDRMFRYEHFVGKLYGTLLEHLDNLTEFSFSANPVGPVGLMGAGHALLPLETSHMRFLQVVELRYCFISTRLAEFISHHLGTLKRVNLTNCYSGEVDEYSEETPGTSWAIFFTIIAEGAKTANRVKLQELTMTPCMLDEDTDGAKDVIKLDTVPIDGPAEDVERAKQILRNEPGRRLFAYAETDDQDNSLFTSEKQNLIAFLAGQDQAAFDGMMSAIGRRRLEASK